MAEEKRGPGRLVTTSKEQRRAQLREGKAAQRERDALAGKVKLEATVQSETKQWFQDYQQQQGHKTLGEAFDAIKLQLNVDMSTRREDN